jgi:hypothetical protein
MTYFPLKLCHFLLSQTQVQDTTYCEAADVLSKGVAHFVLPAYKTGNVRIT